MVRLVRVMGLVGVVGVVEVTGTMGTAVAFSRVAVISRAVGIAGMIVIAGMVVVSRMIATVRAAVAMAFRADAANRMAVMVKVGIAKVARLAQRNVSSWRMIGRSDGKGSWIVAVYRNLQPAVLPIPCAYPCRAFVVLGEEEGGPNTTRQRKIGQFALVVFAEPNGLLEGERPSADEEAFGGGDAQGEGGALYEH